MDKEALIATGYFQNNNFLDKYLELFTEPIEDNNIEKHHIIPRSYYKIIKRPIDDSNKNVRPLSFKNHYLAHYYLIHCTNGELKKKMNYYFTKMNQKIALVAFEINSQIYEALRINAKEQYRDYLRSAKNNIANYNLAHPKGKRTKEHIENMRNGMKRYWEQKKREEDEF
jgi:hypothetical protein